MKDSRFVARFRPTLDLEFPITQKQYQAICSGNPAVQALVEQQAMNALLALLKGSNLNVLEAFVYMDKWTYAAVSEDVRKRIDKVRAWQEKRYQKAAHARAVQWAAEDDAEANAKEGGRE